MPVCTAATGRAGILIGQGKTKDEAMEEVQMVVEGVFSAKAAFALAQKYNVEMPIVEQVNKVLFEDKKPAEAVKELMLRDKKMETGEWSEVRVIAGSARRSFR